MDYKTAIDIFNTLDDDEKSKDMFAHFGLAIYFGQVLEQQAINMICIYRQANDGLTTVEQINSLWDKWDLYSKITFGKLINEIKLLYKISAEDKIELEHILKLRNYIAHDYFRFNAELMQSDSGKKRMIKDFIDFQEKAHLIDNKMSNYLKAFSDKIGFTEDKFNDLLKETQLEWSKKLIGDDYTTIIKKK